MLTIMAPQLRHDAQVTLDRLDNASPADDAFDETFLQDYGASSTRFDVVVRFVTLCGQLVS